MGSVSLLDEDNIADALSCASRGTGWKHLRLDRMLLACARCGHAEIDHRHDDPRHTRCAIDMGGEQCQPCACERFEEAP
jgi:hypothetical protein